MDEASSKYLDKLAMNKLIEEKLMQVSHSPEESLFVNNEVSLEIINEEVIRETEIRVVKEGESTAIYQVPSFCKMPFYENNNMIFIYVYRAKNPEKNILLVHGLFEDNINNYLYTIKQFNDLNYNVYFMTLPYHFDRQPKESKFGGEFFFSADIFRTKNAFKQAVLDIEATKQFIALNNSFPIYFIGYSMGGCVTFRYYQLKGCVNKTFLVNPVADFKNLAWDNYLLGTVGRDLKNSNLGEELVKQILAELDPCENIDDSFRTDNLAMVCSDYDQMISQKQYGHFIKKIGVQKLTHYLSGHLNILRVPRLVGDIHEFLSV